MYWHRLMAMMGGRCENSPGLFPFRAAGPARPFTIIPNFPTKASAPGSRVRWSACNLPDDQTPTAAPRRNPVIKAAYIGFGVVMVALGIIGAFLPLMPTTIFLIIAAWCFARSSPRLEAKLINSRFGAPLRDWRDSGAISHSSKLLAVFCMASGYAIFFATSHPSPIPAVAVGLALLACAAFVLSRPRP